MIALNLASVVLNQSRVMIKCIIIYISNMFLKFFISILVHTYKLARGQLLLSTNICYISTFYDIFWKYEY